MSQKIAVVGAGFIGRSWAMVFSKAGHHVSLYDIDPAALSEAMNLLEINIADLESNGLITSKDDLLGRIQPYKTLEGAVEEAEWVQENAPGVSRPWDGSKLRSESNVVPPGHQNGHKNIENCPNCETSTKNNHLCGISTAFSAFERNSTAIPLEQACVGFLCHSLGHICSSHQISTYNIL